MELVIDAKLKNQESIFSDRVRTPRDNVRIVTSVAVGVTEESPGRGSGSVKIPAQVAENFENLRLKVPKILKISDWPYALLFKKPLAINYDLTSIVLNRGRREYYPSDHSGGAVKGKARRIDLPSFEKFSFSNMKC